MDKPKDRAGRPLDEKEMAVKKKLLMVMGKEAIAASLPTLRPEDIQTTRMQARMPSAGRGNNIVWGDMDPRDSIRILDRDPEDRVIRVDFDPKDPIHP